MTSQDDLGMLWYGVSGVSFNPADPSDVMLNTGSAAPLLSDHPRSIIAPQLTQTPINSQTTIASYGDPANITQQNQMLYDPNTGDYVSQQSDYIYEAYESYEDDSSNNTINQSQQNAHMYNHQIMQTAEDDSNSHTKTKKPKVHQHPSLKLKTPIAYQKDTDLNAIPIMKEGMAVCEKCGAIGVRHAFYGKERKFCSLACARPPSIPSSFPKLNSIEAIKFRKDSIERDGSSINSPHSDDLGTESAVNSILGIPNNRSDFPMTDNADVKSTDIESSSLELNGNATVPSIVNDATTSKTGQSIVKIDLANSYNWESSYFADRDFSAAPVQLFRHAPMSECWEQISAGMKVEVSCGEESVMDDSFWVATVLSLAGYKAQLRFEGFVDDNSKDFWVDLCSEDVHPVGWCATQGKALIPPKSIQHKFKDWKEFLMRRLTGARTLPTNFHTKIAESQSSRFSVGYHLEVVDKNRIAQMRVATVTKVIGKRLHLRYHGAPPYDNGFWCHEESPIIHPVGWSREVGHEIVASQSYHEKCMEDSYDPDDAAPDLFLSPMAYFMPKDERFNIGMKLEAIDPLNLATICVATIMKILGNNYLMIRIDSYDSDNTCSDWFCYHASSPYIFPAGFCEMNSITLSPPRGFDGEFSWFTYLQKTDATAAPPQLFKAEIPNHGYEEGMSLEAVDLMDPRLVCVARVMTVKGRLLKVHFDGWENDFDQWIDYNSCDIYPVGWCKMVQYKLEGPRAQALTTTIQKRRTRGRGGRKGRGIGRRGSQNNKTGIENAFPLLTAQVSNLPMSSNHKRGRKARGRGTSFRMNKKTPPTSLNPDQESSSDMNYGEGELNNTAITTNRARRGRPRKIPLSASNHAVQRPARITRTLASYAQSDEELSMEETSSGVASLADSEASADAWNEDENIDKSHQNNYDISSVAPQPNILDTGYRESLNFKTISDANFLTNEEPSLDCFFNNSESNSEFQVSSTYSSRIPFLEMKDESSSDKYILSNVSNGTPTSTPAISSSPSFNLLESVEQKFIPRLIDNTNILRSGKVVQPKQWTSEDVSTFLKKNECTSYCDNFLTKNIDGTKLLKLSQNEVMELTGMKVGPSLKIHDLIHQLLAIVNPAQARYQATLLKRGMAFGKS